MPENRYQPIDCNFYDRLEAWATLHTRCKIVYTGETGQMQEADRLIVNLYAREGVEYMELDNGQVLRLDQLLTVNGIPAGACKP